MNPLSFPPAQLLWIPDEKSVYELAEIVKDHVIETDQKDEMVIVETLGKNRSQKKIVRSATYAVDKSHLVDLNDLIEMNSLHEGPLLDVLRRRWLKDSMYTYTGDFLVSINPYHRISGLDDNPLQYMDLSLHKVKSKNLAPHVFAIANNSLRELTRNTSSNDVEPDRKTSQSIIVTGESGAGKTEASKQVMNFLTLANKDIFPAAGEVADKIKNVILDSNALFEAFGNAKTVRNDNSSRFGKYIKLQYTEDNQLVAAFTETFLLEKSRLVSVEKNDRNYHIFYQIVRGLDSNTRERLFLNNVDMFRMLSDSGCTVISSEDEDALEFVAVQKALVEMGCSETEIARTWELLACVLHLGNMTVSPTTEGQPVELQSPTIPLENLTSFLGVSVEALTKALTVQIVEVKMRNERYDKILSVDETKNNIGALLKWLYGALFNWLVSRVNSAHKSFAATQKKEIKKYIGILDIFGFEIFITNTFEQLCINYTNERLQQQFNELAFEVEQQEYAKEGLDWTSITYRDNQPVIDLIGKKPKGLLILLEEHSLMNRDPDDQALLNTYHKHHFNSHPNYAKPRFGNESFVIKHFAGDVTYAIANFITKNNDSLQDDLSALLATSGNSFVVDILNCNTAQVASETSSKKIAPATISAGTKIASTVSLSFRFRNQLDTLINSLRSTKAFYIKCIKPNTEKKQGVFDAPLVITQLRYSGVLEIVRIRREGYPTRVPYVDFYTEYQELAHGRGWRKPENCTLDQLKDYCKLLCKEHCPKDSFQLGHKYLFLHHYVPSVMESALHAERMRCATIIQTSYRRHRDRSAYLIKIADIRHRNRMAKATMIQAVFRGHKGRKLANVAHKIKQIIMVQALSRRLLAMKKLRTNKEAAILVQSMSRGMIARRNYRRTRAAILLQSQIRGLIARQKYRATRAAILLQSQIRGLVARRKFAALLAAILLQSNVRKFIARCKYQINRRKVIAIQKAARGLAARKEARLRIKSVLRLQQAAKRFVLNNRNQKFILGFHELCRTADKFPDGINRVKELIMKNSFLYRNKWRDYATMYHSGAAGAQGKLLTALDLNPYDILEKDYRGARLLHHAMARPDLALVKQLCEVMNGLKPPPVSPTAQFDYDNDNEDNDDANSPPKTNGSPSAARQRAGGVDTLTGQRIIKAGWLQKSGTFLGFKRFKRRWCVLTEESFIVYKQPVGKCKSLLTIEGAIVERPSNDLTISVRRPGVAADARRSMFSSEPILANILKADSEIMCQEWLTPLKMAAGVRPFRDGPIKHLDIVLRSTWVRQLSRDFRTPLHVLATLPEAHQESYGDEAIRVAAWLLENGCDILQVDSSGRTALQIAKEMKNNKLIQFLSKRCASLQSEDGHVPQRQRHSVVGEAAKSTKIVMPANIAEVPEEDASKLLLTALKSKGFSYLQLHLQKLYCVDAKMAMTFEKFDNPRMTISICNSQDEPVEVVQVIDAPAIISSGSLWWGYTFYMQTPLENIGDRFSIVFRLIQGPSGDTPLKPVADSRTSSILLSRYVIEKVHIDSGPVKFYFTSKGLPPIPEPVNKVNDRDNFFFRKPSQTPKPPVAQMTYEGCLEADIEITKIFRDVDIDSIDSEPRAQKKFSFTPTPGGPLPTGLASLKPTEETYLASRKPINSGAIAFDKDYNSSRQQSKVGDENPLAAAIHSSKSEASRRNLSVSTGAILPPRPTKVPSIKAQFAEQVNKALSEVESQQQQQMRTVNTSRSAGSDPSSARGSVSAMVVPHKPPRVLTGSATASRRGSNNSIGVTPRPETTSAQISPRDSAVDVTSVDDSSQVSESKAPSKPFRNSSKRPSGSNLSVNTADIERASAPSPRTEASSGPPSKPSKDSRRPSASLEQSSAAV